MVGRQAEWQTTASRSRAWVALGWFWAVVLSCLVAGAMVLQVLGPPPQQTAAAPVVVPPAPAPEPAARAPDPPAPIPPAPPPAQAAGIPAPIAALQEPSPEVEGAMLPRIGPDGRMPARAYAAAFDAADPRPRVAVLLAGLGMAEADSEGAIHATPAAISLAFSPYATRPGPLVEMARAAGHETLVSIPMEPLGYPLNDAGDHALLTGAAPAQNHQHLVWALSRIAGYVGATAAMSGLMGERFAASEQMSPVLDELAARGLLYIEPRPSPAQLVGASPVQPGRRVADLVIDDLPARPEIEARLAQLEQLARDRGSALGLAGRPDPVTVDRLQAWAATLASRGIALVPVSALVPPPAPPASDPPARP
jgi:polysaccharide deacetylase 2 family uncharacterized protein YibQ